jgi:hypothetical protein
MELIEIDQIHQVAVNHGFYDSWPEPTDPSYPAAVLAKLALIHSEVSEILEAYRKRRGSEAIVTEFADTFIRMYDVLVQLYWDGIIDTMNIDDVIRAKTAVNSTRPAMHGNLL